jgi:heme oxygenase
MPHSACPYAVALSEDEASHDASTTTTTAADSSKIAAELSSCPAFSSQNGCPFKEAKSPEEVQRTLAQIPQSHFQDASKKSAFFQVMQHLHQVHEQGGDSDFVKMTGAIVGQECPMKPYVVVSSGDDEDKKVQSFTQAMEDCSLAAIMARLAADMLDKTSDEDSLGHHDDDDDVTPRNSVSTTDTSEAAAAAVVEHETTTKASGMKQEEGEEPQQRSSNASLAQALKTGTTVAHQAAEDVHFVRNFIRGEIDRSLYQELILSLYFVYDALEEALNQHAPTHFPTCHFPHALSRKAALEEDVEFWHATSTPSQNAMSPATREYIERIEHLAAHDPLLLLAHSYTRYLGDLSGGRILARVARKALDLDKTSGEGLAFYRFENVKSYKQFKDDYRKALDELPLTTQQIQALVAEANIAFCFNMRLFQELDVQSAIPGAQVMPLDQVMAFAHPKQNDDGADAASSGEDQCPFLVNKKQQQKQEQHGYSISFNKNTSKAAAAASEDQCPFLVDKKKEQQTKTKTGRCPWPFIFAHDAKQGLMDWQTWLVVALVMAWMFKDKI